MSPSADKRPAEVGEVQGYFAQFAADYPGLPLYRAICLGVAGDAETASLLLYARPGQVRPVLWLAALHDVVLRRPDTPAARWYSSVVGRAVVPDGDPWPDVRHTVLEHADELRELIATRTTQTNEVNRVVYLAAMLALGSADVVDVPAVLVEMGASAGLLLALDRYRVELSQASSAVVFGDEGSSVRCLGQDRSSPHLSPAALPHVVARTGLDLHPVRLDAPGQVRWLMACLWPDVPGRVERLTAALEVLRADPPPVRAGDMVDDLAVSIESAVVQSRSPEAHVVVFSSWALTYVERARRAAVGDILGRVAQRGVPVTWLTAEPPGCMPGLAIPDGLSDSPSGTVLGMRRWRSNREIGPVLLGTSNAHGEWVDVSAGLAELSS